MLPISYSNTKRKKEKLLVRMNVCSHFMSRQYPRLYTPLEKESNPGLTSESQVFEPLNHMGGSNVTLILLFNKNMVLIANIIYTLSF
jgi:hypothetical protein